KTMSLDVFEHNHVTDALAAINIAEPAPVTAGATYLVFYDNHFDRGTAPPTAAQINSQPGFVSLLRSNSFLNYLSPPTSVGLVFLPDIGPAPVIAGPAAAQSVRGISLSFTGSNALSIRDPDAGSSAESIALNVTSGTLALETNSVTVIS